MNDQLPRLPYRRGETSPEHQHVQPPLHLPVEQRPNGRPGFLLQQRLGSFRLGSTSFPRPTRYHLP